MSDTRLKSGQILDACCGGRMWWWRDEDGEIDTAAKFRAIERLARLDWDAEGMSRVV